MTAVFSTASLSISLHLYRNPYPNTDLNISFASIFPSRRRLRRTRKQLKPIPPSTHHQSHSLDSHSVSRLASCYESRFRKFVSDGENAFEDLRTAVKVDDGGRVIFSFRKSSLLYFRNFLVWIFVVVFVFRAVGFTWWRRRWWLWFGGDQVVVKRDRSLGGKEVVVGRRNESSSRNEKVSEGSSNFDKRLNNHFYSAYEGFGRDNFERRAVKIGDDLPDWWPEIVKKPVGSSGKEELQREANRLVRAIMDSRMSGGDYKGDDIIQLREICKSSGARVSFETANARDSFYRAAIEYVVNQCCSVMQPAVQVDGEDAKQFIAGLADNIGLDNFRAARLVKAAVAARTRIEAQGRRAEGLKELAKICQIHQLFPPGNGSAEMEMVASNLSKSLVVEQRKHLLTLLRLVCGSEGQRAAAEALGLVNTSESKGPAA